ncbi:cell wall hydrolase [Sphingomonas sp. MMS24-J13]|uniref:cell wall hydrolase n=1 Tax=Sphingomonas sp. MMS24-J13 TaxID=3238686 RepID=UPI00384E11AA
MTVSDKDGQATVIAVIVAMLAVGVVLALIGMDEPGQRQPQAVAARHHPAALLTPPEVPPTILAEEAPDLARASNAAIPLAPDALLPANPFHYAGTSQDRAAAEACLAVAVLFEAGDDPPGERAVAQVVLNRARHPAFPKTVCGVVFQGSERRTGCQFTFTCDGSLARVQSAAALGRARTIARDALDGAVYRPVGTATHYHTDWVVPYWRSSLEKIAIVHTQIFYRWPGAWGTRAVLNGHIQPGERPDTRLARFVDLKTGPDSPMAEAQAALPVPPGLTVANVPPASLNGNIVRLKDEDAGQFVVELNPATPPASYAVTGFNLCGEKLECMVFGWTSASQIPRSLPVLPWMMKSLAFVYRRSRALGLSQGYWDCQRFPRPLPAQCLTP